MKIGISGLLLMLTSLAYGQHTLLVQVRHAQTNQPLPGATIAITGTTFGAATDSSGRATLTNLPAMHTKIRASAVGFDTYTTLIALPLSDTLRLMLEPSEEELDEVIVSSTRTGRTVADEPTRVEVIDAEELDEKANMQPGNIAVILKESPGIQVQQTSLTSANATFRIQGLDGRYTQLLQDGLPLYSGFSGGLSLMQTPPLNLRQVEVLKGCQSTLYGSGAIAGLVNLVTKLPTARPELSFLVNGTSAGGLDLNGFYAGRWQKIGLTLYATHNLQRAFDPNNDQFSDLPQTARTTLQPRLFWYPDERTTVSAGLIFSNESRTGGYLPAIRSEASGYTEVNDSRRVATQFRAERRLNEVATLSLKNSFSQFYRQISLPGYQFSGLQRSSFTEANYFRHRSRMDWIVGLNLWTDNFTDQNPPIFGSRSYGQTTAGVFVQNTATLSEKFTLETGLRLDVARSAATDVAKNTGTQTLLLPRLSLFYRVGSHWTSRLGGGLGYKTPNIFTEEAERESFRGIRQVAFGPRFENSAGLNWDVNYRTELGDGITLAVNQLFFLTQLNRPLVFRTTPTDNLLLQNAVGNIVTRGFETNIRLVVHDIHGFVGYSFIDAQRRYDGLTGQLPLTAKHRLYFTTLYETETLKTGFEAFYVGPQQRNNGTPTRDYWTVGYMIEKKWTIGKATKASVFINFENFLDARQSRYETLVTGPTDRPSFATDIYAPTDGRVINGGFKLKI